MPYLETRDFADSIHAQSGGGIPDSVVASTASVASMSRRERLNSITDANWQTRLRHADREGPGIVGASLDMPAATSMLLELCVRRKTARGYEVIKDDPVIAAVLGMWRGESITQQHLFSRLIRTLDGPAECYLALHNAEMLGQGRLYWQLAQTTQVTDNRDGTSIIRGRPDARQGDKHYAQVKNRWVYHAMNADLEWDGTAWSPLRRGLPHVEQYKAAMRTISRSLDSQLALNGILWAKAVGKATNWPDMIKSWAMRGVQADDTVESVSPFPMSTEEEPKFIETGRDVSDQQIRVAEFFLKTFAQSTDLPTQMLLEGPGQGTMWNSYLEGDFYSDMVMGPRWQRACAVITETHLRPLLRAIPRTAGHLNVDDLEVWADDTRIRTKTDNTQRIIDSRALGIPTREAVGEAIGLNPDQIMDPDSEEYAEWLIESGRAPAAEPAPVEPLALGVGDSTADDPPGEPSQEDAEARQMRILNNGPTQPDPDLMAAEAEVHGELSTVRPSYWNELVPTR